MKRRQPEAQLQRSVFEHFKLRRAPGVVAFHIPLGGWRTRTEGAILKSMGTLAGCPDICAIRNGRAFFLELKVAGARLSKTQRECHAALAAAGAIVGTAVGIDAALDWLEGHQLLKGRRQ
jgi:hypothetical protein